MDESLRLNQGTLAARLHVMGITIYTDMRQCKHGNITDGFNKSCETYGADII
jgi:hypothetical protein